MIYFDAPSIAAYKLAPVILQIVSATATSLVVKVDKESDCALSFADPDTAPEFLTCKIYQQAGNPIKWQYVQDPTYFLGVKVTKDFTTADIPEDGIYKLEDFAVAHPPGFDPLYPVFVLEGRNGSGAWEPISDAASRLFILPNKSRLALKTAKPVEAATSAVPFESSLTDTYSRFRVIYYKKTTSGDGACTIPCYAKCKWARRDYSASVGNYGASQGTAIDSKGHHHYCDKKRYLEFTLSDNYPEGAPDGLMDTATGEINFPSGISRFPDDGICSQYNCCTQFTPAENDFTKDAPFDYQHHAGTIFLELWGGINHALMQKEGTVGSQGYNSHYVRRVLGPSLCWLTGYYPIETVGGMHLQNTFPGNGCWAPPTIRTEGTNQYMYPSLGTVFEYVSGDIPLDAGEVPAEGFYPRTVPGFKTSRDPMDYSATIDVLPLERFGIRIERDTGELKARGISYAPGAKTAQDIIIPNLLPSGGMQQRAMGSYNSDSKRLTIVPLRQETKSEKNIGQRTIASITNEGSGIIAVELENGLHQYSFIEDGPEIGDSFDRIVSWQGGGKAPVHPADYQQINSYHELDKSLGAGTGGASRGDVVEIQGKRFFVVEVIPFGGSEAPTWGDTRDVVSFQIFGGYFIMPDGSELVSVTRQSDSVPFTAVNSATKPAIGSGQYWLGQDSQLYFAAADHGETTVIAYMQDDVLTYAYFPIIEALTTTTSMLKATYDGADSTQLLIAGVAASIVTGTPSKGQVVIGESGGYLQLTFSADNGGDTVTVIANKLEEAPAPQDYYAIGGNYTSYGKRQDLVRLRDDAGSYLATNGASLIGTNCDFYQGAGVFLPEITGLQWADYKQDNWQEIIGYTVHGAEGYIDLPSSLELPGTGFCLKVRGCRLMDHRGRLPAVIWNKTRQSLDAIQWCFTGFIGGYGAFSFCATAARINLPDGTNTVTYDFDAPPSGNNIGGSQGAPPADPYNSSQDDAVISFAGQAFGLPLLYQGLPDGCTILEAKIEVTVTDTVITSYSYEYKPDPDLGGYYMPVGSSTETHTPTGFVLLGGTGPVDNISWAVIGYFPSAGSGSTVVADCTAIMQTLYDNRNNEMHSFCLVPSAKALTGGASVKDMLDELLGEPPPRATVDWNADGVITPNDAPIGSGPGEENCIVGPITGANASYGDISIGKLAIKVQYPDSALVHEIIMPRWPAMA